MLFKVWRKNPYFKMGDVYRKFDDGCEKCIMGMQDGRQHILGYSGIVIPYDELRPFVIALQRNGFDREALEIKQAPDSYRPKLRMEGDDDHGA